MPVHDGPAAHRHVAAQVVDPGRERAASGASRAAPRRAARARARRRRRATRPRPPRRAARARSSSGGARPRAALEGAGGDARTRCARARASPACSSAAHAASSGPIAAAARCQARRSTSRSGSAAGERARAPRAAPRARRVGVDRRARQRVAERRPSPPPSVTRPASLGGGERRRRRARARRGRARQQRRGRRRRSRRPARAAGASRSRQPLDAPQERLRRCARDGTGPRARQRASRRAPRRASSSSASGLPPVARYSRSTAVVGDVAPAEQLRGASRGRARRARSAGRSAPSSSDGSPSRTASTSAIGSATSRRAAKSSACALECVQPLRVVDEQRAAAAPPRRRRAGSSVAAPTANRSRAGRRARSASAPASAVACGAGIRSSGAERRPQQLGEPGERDLRLGLDPARAQHAHAAGAPRPRSRAARSCRSPARRRARARRCARRAPRRAGGRAPAARRRGRAAWPESDESPPVRALARRRTRWPPDATAGAPAYGRAQSIQGGTMAPLEEPVAVDGDKLEQFVFRAVDEVGATLNAALVVMGDKLGLYRALAGAGAADARSSSPSAPASSERYVREWLQRPGRRRLRRVRPGRRPLHAAARAGGRADRRRRARPTCRASSRSRSARCIDSPRITEAARSGEGVGWHEHDARRVRRLRALLPARLQREPGRRLAAGARRRRREARGAARTVADIGCGHGSSTILMAQAFPNSTFVGSDYHAGSIETARAAGRGGGRRRPRDASRSPRPPRIPGDGYDLVTMFDCLHDMGDPVGRRAPRARHARAGRHVDDRRADRRRPRRGQPQPGRPRVLRLLDAALHAGVAVAGGRARARRAGRRGADPRRRRRRAASRRFRRAAETPFNLVFEARP